jgi:HK97 family phage portal protein
MRLADRIREFFAQRLTRYTRYPWQNPRQWGAKTAAGLFITPDRALRSSTVWACHRYLSQTVAQLPVRVMRIRNDGTGTAERVPASPRIHATDYCLNWRPNPEIGPFQLKETLIGWALIWGNGYAEIERDLVGNLANLWPIEPWRVRVLRDDGGNLFYRVNNGTFPPVDLPAADVFHIRGFGNGPVGLSVVEYAAQTIGWQQATELFGATFFGEGMSFGGAVTLKRRGSAEGIRRMRTELEEQHKGVARSNRWVFLDDEASFQKMSASPNEAQFLESMQFQVEEICRWFGVPPQKVMHLLRMTFNNVEQLSIEVVQDSITPWAMRWEEEGTFKLFGANRNNLFLKMDLKGLLRGDFETRQAGLQIMRRNGCLTADQWCDIEDMPRVGAAAGGGKYVIEGNMTTLDALGEIQVPNSMPIPPSAPPKAPAPKEPNDPGKAALIRRAGRRLHAAA